MKKLSATTKVGITYICMVVMVALFMLAGTMLK